MKYLREVVEKEVATFRRGAPITTYDIRIVAAADGYDLTPYSNRQIGAMLGSVCRSAEGPHGPHDRRSFYRRDAEAGA